MLQALASDIDHTLFFQERNQQISIQDCQAIQNYQNQGHANYIDKITDAVFDNL